MLFRSQKRVEQVAGRLVDTLTQEDIFFRVLNGRLKLRTEGGRHGQLIHYFREDKLGPKKSEYEIVEVPNAPQLKDVLSEALDS